MVFSDSFSKAAQGDALKAQGDALKQHRPSTRKPLRIDAPGQAFTGAPRGKLSPLAAHNLPKLPCERYPTASGSANLAERVNNERARLEFRALLEQNFKKNSGALPKQFERQSDDTCQSLFRNNTLPPLDRRENTPARKEPLGHSVFAVLGPPLEENDRLDRDCSQGANAL